MDKRTAFAAGFKRNSIVVLIIALLVSPSILMFIEWTVVSGKYTIIPEPYLLGNQNNDYLHVSYQMFNLKPNRPETMPVYITGGSSIREGIESDEDLSEKISERYNVDTEVYQFASSKQTMAETLSIIDNLPGGKGIVIVGVNYNNMLGSDKSQNYAQLKGDKLLLKSTHLRDALNRYAGEAVTYYTILPGILNQTLAYSGKYLIKNTLKHKSIKVQYLLHRYNKPLTFEERKTNVEQLKAILSVAEDETARLNIYLAKEIIKLGRSKGFDIIFVDTPINKDGIGSQLDDVNRFYRTTMRNITTEDDVLYCDFIWDMQIENTEFADLAHLITKGARDAFQERLVDGIRPSFVRFEKGGL